MIRKYYAIVREKCFDIMKQIIEPKHIIYQKINLLALTKYTILKRTRRVVNDKIFIISISNGI